ncbi:MAG TPA: RIP metalloprotease RseP [Nitrospirae bacterium]|nr:metalloprotease MmpA [bacterium BMS3Bbin09]HDO66778.1 RIP metalloprotease RseP [Nitrospirota bacterium]HDZ84041.1 RIP metalloprotease RseP [Nitrospirota bacterium]HEW80952.1 RIP metalloprotease RseP [Nitrospirota bacterium]
MTILWAAILFGSLIFFHELGHFIVAKMVGVRVLKFSLGFGPKLLGKKIGDTEYLLSAIPLGGYVKPLGEDPEDELTEEEKPYSFGYQPVWKRAAIVIAGPVFNLVLAFLIFTSFLALNYPIIVPDLDSITTAINDVTEGSPAEAAGFLSGDEITAINGTDIMDWSEMAAVFSKSPGKELDVKVRRGDKVLNITVTPASEKGMDENGEEATVGRIGISKKMSGNVIQSDSIFSAPVKGVQAVYEWSSLTLDVVAKLVTGNMSAKMMGGPIVIVNEAAKAAEVGAYPYLNLIAIISINLAILNLLPVPVLDGGHLLFFGIEALRRKPLSDKIMIVANKIGMTLLLLLIAFVIYNDTLKVIVPWVKRTILN